MLIKQIQSQQQKNIRNQKLTQNKEINRTLQGILVNNHVKNENETSSSFSDIQNSLLIYDVSKYKKQMQNEEDISESIFNENNAIKPLLLGTGLTLAGIVGISSILKSSSKALLNTKNFEHLPDIAINMNIKEEPHFVLYRAIRNPNFKNIIGAVAVFVMSGITLISKNFVDGAKEIWIKKKNADIEKTLQENLIEVETNSFSGKLEIINNMLHNNVKFFDSVLNKKQNAIQKEPIIFASFKGNKKEEKVNNNKTERIKNIKYAILTAGIVTSAILLGKFSLSNIRKTAQYSNNFANNLTEKTIDTIQEMSNKSDKKDLPQIIELLKSICAKPEFIKEVGTKYKLTEKEIQNIISDVEISKKTIFADAPLALGGIPQKIQYYCYVDENRGHLYNWILNPENKFTKYVFSAFTITSAIGYLFRQSIDAIKEVAVLKENAKTELNLRKRLIDVEIRNFKAKKESAINPLIEDFKKQAESGTKTKEELKQIAENILLETKNGPPYVYT